MGQVMSAEMRGRGGLASFCHGVGLDGVGWVLLHETVLVSSAGEGKGGWVSFCWPAWKEGLSQVLLRK